VLPDGYADVIVSGEGHCVVVGPTTVPTSVALAPGARLRGVRLQSAAISAVFGCPAAELTGATVDLADVVTRGADELAGDIWAGRVPALISAATLDLRTVRAVALLQGIEPVLVADVATEVGLSTRQLLRLLTTHTGLGPKSLQRVARLQRFLAGVTCSRPDVTLASLAAEAGYADQAHLNHDVHALAGTTPGELRASYAPLHDVERGW